MVRSTKKEAPHGIHSSSNPNCPVKARMHIGKNSYFIDLKKEAGIIRNEHEVFGRVKQELVEKQTTLEKLVAEELSKRMLAIYVCNDFEVSRRWQQLELAVKGLESWLKIQESIQTTVEEIIQTFTNVQQEIMNMMKEIRYEMPRMEVMNKKFAWRENTEELLKY